MVQLNLLPGAINEMMVCVADTQRLTWADRYGLLAAVLDESLSEEERLCVDRLLRCFTKGRIKISQELSMIL